MSIGELVVPFHFYDTTFEYRLYCVSVVGNIDKNVTGLAAVKEEISVDLTIVERICHVPKSLLIHVFNALVDSKRILKEAKEHILPFTQFVKEKEGGWVQFDTLHTKPV